MNKCSPVSFINSLYDRLHVWYRRHDIIPLDLGVVVSSLLSKDLHYLFYFFFFFGVGGLNFYCSAKNLNVNI